MGPSIGLKWTSHIHCAGEMASSAFAEKQWTVWPVWAAEFKHTETVTQPQHCLGTPLSLWDLHKSNIPLGFFLSHSYLPGVLTHSVIWWYRALAEILACAVLSSRPSLASCSLHNASYPHAVREVVLCTGGFRKVNQTKISQTWWNGLYLTQTSSFFCWITRRPHKQLGQHKQRKPGVCSGEEERMPEEQDLYIQPCFWIPGSSSCGQDLASMLETHGPPAGVCEETTSAYISPRLVDCSQHWAVRGSHLTSPHPALLCWVYKIQVLATR